jgi:hypothetical protein
MYCVAETGETDKYAETGETDKSPQGGIKPKKYVLC